MATGPWRCSQCGTINEPVANSCRTCGKWPSLFDLEESVVDEAELEQLPERYREPETVEPYDPRPVEVETFERPRESVPETFEPDPADFDVPAAEPEEEQSRRPRWVSWLVPAAFVVYLAISYFIQSR